jgi:signal transduction histidine kinase
VRRLTYLPLGVKLTAVIFAALIVALGVVYLWVVPRLESRLADAKLRELREAAQGLAFELDTAIGGPTPVVLDPVARGRRLEQTAQRISGRAILLFRLNPVREEVAVLGVLDDTNRLDSGDIARDPLALRAESAKRLVSGRVERDGNDYAEVATVLPVTPGSVLLLAAPLETLVTTAAPIRRSVLIAGAIGLAGAMAAGSLGTLRYVRRIRRLEAAAERIAAGDLSQPVRVEGRDEIGQLAEAFENMRAKLEGLDRARREFVANASHELKTPLFALGGFLELMTEEDLDEDTREEFTEQMAGQVERLARLTTDLLDLSRIDAGELVVEQEPVSLAAVAETIVEEFAAVAVAGERELVAGRTDSVAAIGDEQRIERIGRALVENALRHTPPGTRIEVSVSGTDAHARLLVGDDGPGVSAEETERVFERFYRADGRAAHGSGLGLAIARETAGLMGGALSLEPASDNTVFVLELARSSEELFPRENDRVPVMGAR